MNSIDLKMQINELKNRLDAVKSIKKIANAMRSISISKMKSAQLAFAKFSTYESVFTKIMIEILLSSYKNSPLIEDAKKLFNTDNLLLCLDKISLNLYDQNSCVNKILIVFSTDTGLCGSFFSNCLKKVEEIKKDISFNKIFVFGKKMLTSIKGAVGIDAHDIESIDNFSTNIIKNYANNSHIYILYSEFISVSNVLLKQVNFNTNIFNLDNLHDDTYFNDISEVSMSYLIEVFMKNLIAKCYLSNLVSQHASRFFVMENASKSAQDMIDVIDIQYNKLRQSKITMDLLRGSS